MGKVHIDFFGPLLKTEKGNQYILEMVDSFTKWEVCILLPSQHAEVKISAVINNFLSRFGYLYQINSDQGRNF